MLFAAALLHDVGKPLATREIDENSSGWPIVSLDAARRMSGISAEDSQGPGFLRRLPAGLHCTGKSSFHSEINLLRRRELLHDSRLLGGRQFTAGAALGFLDVRGEP